jgi:hypothetical protein
LQVRSLHFTTKSTKDTKLKNGIKRFVLFVVQKKNLHLRQLRCAPFPQVKRMAMNCCKRPAGYSNKISAVPGDAVPACFIMK